MDRFFSRFIVLMRYAPEASRIPMPLGISIVKATVIAVTVFEVSAEPVESHFVWPPPPMPLRRPDRPFTFVSVARARFPISRKVAGGCCKRELIAYAEIPPGRCD